MPDPSDICFLSAVEMRQLLHRKEISAVELLHAHLAQIERFNPQVNAIITLTPERALQQARAADAAFAKGESLGALHGLPTAHKDLQPTSEIRTTSGSPIYRDWIPDFDSLLIERLKNAGVVQLGKTNVPEFGAGSQTYNPLFGATRNPYDLTKTCGGSTGGGAVALACGMMPITDGSDMGGSLRNPASFCNVVGLRPSPGRVPSYPTTNGWQTLAVEGPMARTVADVALLMTVMAGFDRRAPLAIAESGEVFAQSLEREFKGVRVAWADKLLGLPFAPEVKEAFAAQRKIFEDLGCIVENAEPDFTGVEDAFMNLRHLAFHLRVTAEGAARRALFKPEILWHDEAGAKLTAAQIGQAESKHTELYDRMRKFMERYEFFVLPVSQVLPFDVNEHWVTEIDNVAMSDYIAWMKSCWYISTVSNPALSVPAAFVNGLPFGIQIAGRHFDDFGVLQLGHAFETASGSLWKQRPGVVNVK